VGFSKLPLTIRSIALALPTKDSPPAMMERPNFERLVFMWLERCCGCFSGEIRKRSGFACESAFNFGRAPGLQIFFVRVFHGIDQRSLAFFANRALAIAATSADSQVVVPLAIITHNLNQSVFVALRAFGPHEHFTIRV